MVFKMKNKLMTYLQHDMYKLNACFKMGQRNYLDKINDRCIQ